LNSIHIKAEAVKTSRQETAWQRMPHPAATGGTASRSGEATPPTEPNTGVKAG